MMSAMRERVVPRRARKRRRGRGGGGGGGVVVCDIVGEVVKVDVAVSFPVAAACAGESANPSVRGECCCCCRRRYPSKTLPK